MTSKARDNLLPDGQPTGAGAILFVDDDVFLVSVGREMLEKLGYRVAAFSNGIAALSAFRENPQAFDLVITDHVMPEMSGVELAREILKLKPGLPIILCTGFGHKLSAEEARRVGFLDYLHKPVGMRDLNEAIRRALAAGAAPSA